MRLYQDKDWKSVRFTSGRTVLRRDKYLYDTFGWENLTHNIEVAPLDMEGNYKEVVKER